MASPTGLRCVVNQVWHRRRTQGVHVRRLAQRALQVEQCTVASTMRMLTASSRRSWTDVVGVGLLGGIGFTVSLLIGELSFGTDKQRPRRLRQDRRPDRITVRRRVDRGPAATAEPDLPPAARSRNRRRRPRRRPRRLRNDIGVNRPSTGWPGETISARPKGSLRARPSLSSRRRLVRMAAGPAPRRDAPGPHHRLPRRQTGPNWTFDSGRDG